MKEFKNYSINDMIDINLGHGSKEDREKFKLACDEDIALRAQYLGIVKMRKDYPDEDPLQVIQRLMAKPKLEKRTVSNRRIYFWSALTAACLIFVMCVWYFVPSDSERIAQTYHKKSPIWSPINSIKGSNSKVKPEWVLAYENNRLTEVIEILSKKEVNTPLEKLYIGYCFIYSKKQNLEKARKILAEIVNVQDEEIRSKARFYTGFSYLLQHNLTMAMLFLSEEEFNELDPYFRE